MSNLLSGFRYKSTENSETVKLKHSSRKGKFITINSNLKGRVIKGV